MLRTTDSSFEGVINSEFSLICVGTPTCKNGRLDISGIEKVAQELGRALRQKDAFHTIAIRITVLPGTTEDLIVPILEAESGKRVDCDFAICYNLEFMREGSSVRDFRTPPFTVIGARDPGACKETRGPVQLHQGADH